MLLIGLDLPREHGLSLKSLQLEAVTSCSPHSSRACSSQQGGLHRAPPWLTQSTFSLQGYTSLSFPWTALPEGERLGKGRLVEQTSAPIIRPDLRVSTGAHHLPPTMPILNSPSLSYHLEWPKPSTLIPGPVLWFFCGSPQTSHHLFFYTGTSSSRSAGLPGPSGCAACPAALLQRPLQFWAPLKAGSLSCHSVYGLERDL